MHLNDMTSKYLDTVVHKKKTVQIRHSLPDSASTSKMLEKVDYPCGICNKECIEVTEMRVATYENFSVQSDK